MRTFTLAGISVPLVIAAAGVWVAGADEPPTELEKARTAFNKAREKHRDELLKQFDEAVERITKQKLGAEERAKRVEYVKAEKERFEKEGLIPWSETMRHPLTAYQKNLGLIEAPLRKAFDREIDKSLKAKDSEKVNKLRSDLATSLDVKVVATWFHKSAGINGEIKLYSNGKIGGADGEATWSFQNGVLTLRWPDPRAPGGAWVDTCAVSADGRTYLGKNQKGPQVGGSYVVRP